MSPPEYASNSDRDLKAPNKTAKGVTVGRENAEPEVISGCCFSIVNSSGSNMRVNSQCNQLRVSKVKLSTSVFSV